MGRILIVFVALLGMAADVGGGTPRRALLRLVWGEVPLYELSALRRVFSSSILGMRYAKCRTKAFVTEFIILGKVAVGSRASIVINQVVWLPKRPEISTRTVIRAHLSLSCLGTLGSSLVLRNEFSHSQPIFSPEVGTLRIHVVEIYR